MALVQSGQGNLQTLFAQLISCTGVAAYVGDVDWVISPTLTVNLLSQAQIEGFCNQALVIAAAQVKAKLAEISLEMNVVGGAATISKSGSSIDSFKGAWDFSLSAESLPSSTFEALRK